MWKTIKIVCFVLVFIAFNIISIEANAQCAMCQATVASNIDNGGGVGKSLNNGIMYLLAAPYLAMVGIGYLWYKKYRKKNIVIDMKREKINLN